MSLSFIDNFNSILTFSNTDYCSFRVLARHSFLFSQYGFKLTVNSDPWINKTSIPPNEQIHLIIFIDPPLMYLNSSNKQLVSHWFYISTFDLLLPWFTIYFFILTDFKKWEIKHKQWMGFQIQTLHLSAFIQEELTMKDILKFFSI